MSKNKKIEISFLIAGFIMALVAFILLFTKQAFRINFPGLMGGTFTASFMMLVTGGVWEESGTLYPTLTNFRASVGSLIAFIFIIIALVFSLFLFYIVIKNKLGKRAYNRTIFFIFVLMLTFSILMVLTKAFVVNIYEADGNMFHRTHEALKDATSITPAIIISAVFGFISSASFFTSAVFHFLEIKRLKEIK